MYQTNTPREELDEPVTVQVIRVIRPGMEDAFEAALHDFIERTLTLPDQQGVHVLRPRSGTDSREYTILRRFASRQAHDDFFNSPVFAEWQETVAPFIEGEPHYETVSGLETWFALPGNPAIIPPPRWKMALVTLLAVYPLSLVLHQTVAPAIKSWPPLLQTLTISCCMVAMLTWVLMPNLTRLLRGWIHPKVPGEKRDHK